MKKFKITYTKTIEIEGDDKASAIKQADKLFKKYDVKEIAVKATEIKPKKKKGDVPKKLVALAKLLAKEKVDTIVFPESESFVYQYRINGTDCNAKVYSKGKEVRNDWEVRMELGEIFRKKIISGYQGGVTVEGRDVMNILSRFGVTCYLGKISPKHYLEADYQFSVEEGSDS